MRWIYAPQGFPILWRIIYDACTFIFFRWKCKKKKKKKKKFSRVSLAVFNDRFPLIIKKSIHARGDTFYFSTATLNNLIKITFRITSRYSISYSLANIHSVAVYMSALKKLSDKRFVVSLTRFVPFPTLFIPSRVNSPSEKHTRRADRGRPQSKWK